MNTDNAFADIRREIGKLGEIENYKIERNKRSQIQPQT
jgi:hypothetical protein